MNRRKTKTVNALGQQWQKSVRFRSESFAPILSICGPSGAGKTTVIKSLADRYPVFIETTNSNPHLEGLLKDSCNFNAAANQRWFLHRIGKHIASANRQLPLILDQDPAAIVLAYSKMFLEEGKIMTSQYTSLVQKLLKIEGTLQDWKCPRTVLFLDAPAEVLHQRVLRRSGKTLTPTLKWFDRVRSHFIQLFTCFPNAINISTERFSQEQVLAKV